MSALYLCKSCDTYQKGRGPHVRCEACGVEGEIVREPEAGEREEGEKEL